MVNWKISIVGAVLVAVLGFCLQLFVGFGLVWGALVSGMIVGYLVNNGFKNGIINGFMAGLIGGLVLGILFYLVYIIVPHTSNIDISPLVVLVTSLFGMAVIFSFLGTVGGFIGYMIKILANKMNLNNE